MSLWVICEYCGERYDTRKSHFDTCEGYKKHEGDRMIGYKDNSNLDEIFNKKEKEYKPISKELASALSNMHAKLGDDKFNLVISIVMTAAKEKDKKGEKFEYKDLERVLKKAIEIVNEF